MAIEQLVKVQAPGLPLLHVGVGFQHFHAADHFLDGAEAQFCHYLPQFLGHKEEVIDDVFGLAGEARPKFRVLGGNAHRAGVQVALAQHDAAADDQGRSGEADFVGAQQESDGGVAASLELSVGLHHYAAAQVVGDQDLLGLGQTQFPRQAGVFNGRLGRRPGAAVVAAYQHHVAVALGHTRGNGTDAYLGHQLHVNAGLGVDILQVVNQLRQVFDGVDVVMGRRRNKLHARRGMTHPADEVIHLMTGKLAALAGLGSLGHLDLQVGGVDQVIGGYAEATRCNLLDGAVAGIAVFVGSVAVEVLAALAGVAAGADAVHGDGHGLVGFLTDGTEGRGAGGEPPDYLLGRLHLVQRHRVAAGLEIQQTAQGGKLATLVVDRLAELLVRLPVIGAGGVLELGDGVGVPLVDLAVAAPLVSPTGVQVQGCVNLVLREGKVVPLQLLFLHHLQADALDAGRSPGEVLVDKVLVQAHGLENLGALVALHGGNAHLGHDLEQALFVGLDEVLDGVVWLGPVQFATVGQVLNGGQSQVGIYGTGAIAQQQAEVVNLAGFARFHYQAHPGASAFPDQVVVDSGGG